MSKIIVIKVESSIVTNDGGRVDPEIISKWVKQIYSLKKMDVLERDISTLIQNF